MQQNVLSLDELAAFNARVCKWRIDMSFVPFGCIVDKLGAKYKNKQPNNAIRKYTRTFIFVDSATFDIFLNFILVTVYV